MDDPNLKGMEKLKGRNVGIIIKFISGNPGRNVEEICTMMARHLQQPVIIKKSTGPK